MSKVAKPLYPHVPKSRTKGRLEVLREILAAKTVADVIILKGKYRDVKLTSDDVAAIDEHIARLGKTEQEPAPQVKEPYPYHGIAYGHRGEILDTDDFKTLPPPSLIACWADLIAKKEFGEYGGLRRKMPVNNIVITGPEGYRKKWTMTEILSLFP